MTSQQLTLEEIAQLTGCEVVGDPHKVIKGIAELGKATSDEASFFVQLPYGPDQTQALKKSQAGVIFIPRHAARDKERNYLLADDPSLAFQNFAKIFLNTSKRSSAFEGIHPTAIIEPSASIGEGVSIGPYVVVDKEVHVGANTRIEAHAFIGAGTSIGENCHIYPRVVIREVCIIGNRVIIQPGAVIGSCGFGYSTDRSGKHTKLEQLGNVIIEDDVEIGANTCIDRARFRTTHIKRGSKIDNLVQIGHNVVLGEDNIVCGQTGIAGSTETGRCVIMGGQVAITGHITLNSGVVVAGRGAVTKNLTEPGVYAGMPALPMSEAAEQYINIRRLSKYAETLKQLKESIKAIQEQNQKS